MNEHPREGADAGAAPRWSPSSSALQLARCHSSSTIVSQRSAEHTATLHATLHGSDLFECYAGGGLLGVRTLALDQDHREWTEVDCDRGPLWLPEGTITTVPMPGALGLFCFGGLSGEASPPRTPRSPRLWGRVYSGIPAKARRGLIKKESSLTQNKLFAAPPENRHATNDAWLLQIADDGKSEWRQLHLRGAVPDLAGHASTAYLHNSGVTIAVMHGGHDWLERPSDVLYVVNLGTHVATALGHTGCVLLQHSIAPIRTATPRRVPPLLFFGGFSLPSPSPDPAPRQRYVLNTTPSIFDYQSRTRFDISAPPNGPVTTNSIWCYAENESLLVHVNPDAGGTVAAVRIVEADGTVADDAHPPVWEVVVEAPPGWEPGAPIPSSTPGLLLGRDVSLAVRCGSSAPVSVALRTPTALLSLRLQGAALEDEGGMDAGQALAAVLTADHLEPTARAEAELPRSLSATQRTLRSFDEGERRPVPPVLTESLRTTPRASTPPRLPMIPDVHAAAEHRALTAREPRTDPRPAPPSLPPPTKVRAQTSHAHRIARRLNAETRMTPAMARLCPRPPPQLGASWSPRPSATMSPPGTAASGHKSPHRKSAGLPVMSTLGARQAGLAGDQRPLLQRLQDITASTKRQVLVFDWDIPPPAQGHERAGSEQSTETLAPEGPCGVRELCAPLPVVVTDEDVSVARRILASVGIPAQPRQCDAAPHSRPQPRTAPPAPPGAEYPVAPSDVVFVAEFLQSAPRITGLDLHHRPLTARASAELLEAVRRCGTVTAITNIGRCDREQDATLLALAALDNKESVQEARVQRRAATAKRSQARAVRAQAETKAQRRRRLFFVRQRVDVVYAELLARLVLEERALRSRYLTTAQRMEHTALVSWHHNNVAAITRSEAVARQQDLDRRALELRQEQHGAALAKAFTTERRDMVRRFQDRRLMIRKDEIDAARASRHARDAFLTEEREARAAARREEEDAFAVVRGHQAGVLREWREAIEARQREAFAEQRRAELAVAAQRREKERLQEQRELQQKLQGREREDAEKVEAQARQRLLQEETEVRIDARVQHDSLRRAMNYALRCCQRGEAAEMENVITMTGATCQEAALDMVADSRATIGAGVEVAECNVVRGSVSTPLFHSACSLTVTVPLPTYVEVARAVLASDAAPKSPQTPPPKMRPHRRHRDSDAAPAHRYAEVVERFGSHALAAHTAGAAALEPREVTEEEWTESKTQWQRATIDVGIAPDSRPPPADFTFVLKVDPCVGLVSRDGSKLVHRETGEPVVVYVQGPKTLKIFIAPEHSSQALAEELCKGIHIATRSRQVFHCTVLATITAHFSVPDPAVCEAGESLIKALNKERIAARQPPLDPFTGRPCRNALSLSDAHDDHSSESGSDGADDDGQSATSKVSKPFASFTHRGLVAAPGPDDQSSGADSDAEGAESGINEVMCASTIGSTVVSTTQVLCLTRSHDPVFLFGELATGQLVYPERSGTMPLLGELSRLELPPSVAWDEVVLTLDLGDVVDTADALLFQEGPVVIDRQSVSVNGLPLATITAPGILAFIANRIPRALGASSKVSFAFKSSATSTNVATLLRSLCFANDAQDPVLGERCLTVSVTVPGLNLDASTTVTVAVVQSDQPTVFDAGFAPLVFRSTLAVPEDLAAHIAPFADQPFYPMARGVVYDFDTAEFSGGFLELTVRPAPGDSYDASDAVLLIAPPAGNPITVAGAVIAADGTDIGTATTGPQSLLIRFSDRGPSIAATDSLLRCVTLSTERRFKGRALHLCIEFVAGQGADPVKQTITVLHDDSVLQHTTGFAVATAVAAPPTAASPVERSTSLDGSPRPVAVAPMGSLFLQSHHALWDGGFVWLDSVTPAGAPAPSSKTHDSWELLEGGSVATEPLSPEAAARVAALFDTDAAEGRAAPPGPRINTAEFLELPLHAQMRVLLGEKRRLVEDNLRRHLAGVRKANGVVLTEQAVRAARLVTVDGAAIAVLVLCPGHAALLFGDPMQRACSINVVTPTAATGDAAQESVRAVLSNLRFMTPLGGESRVVRIVSSDGQPHYSVAAYQVEVAPPSTATCIHRHPTPCVFTSHTKQDAEGFMPFAAVSLTNAGQCAFNGGRLSVGFAAGYAPGDQLALLSPAQQRKHGVPGDRVVTAAVHRLYEAPPKAGRLTGGGGRVALVMGDWHFADAAVDPAGPARHSSLHVTFRPLPAFTDPADVDTHEKAEAAPGVVSLALVQHLLGLVTYTSLSTAVVPGSRLLQVSLATRHDNAGRMHLLLTVRPPLLTFADAHRMPRVAPLAIPATEEARSAEAAAAAKERSAASRRALWSAGSHATPTFDAGAARRRQSGVTLASRDSARSGQESPGGCTLTSIPPPSLGTEAVGSPGPSPPPSMLPTFPVTVMEPEPLPNRHAGEYVELLLCPDAVVQVPTESEIKEGAVTVSIVRPAESNHPDSVVESSATFGPVSPHGLRGAGINWGQLPGLIVGQDVGSPMGSPAAHALPSPMSGTMEQSQPGLQVSFEPHELYVDFDLDGTVADDMNDLAHCAHPVASTDDQGRRGSTVRVPTPFKGAPLRTGPGPLERFVLVEDNTLVVEDITLDAHNRSGDRPGPDNTPRSQRWGSLSMSAGRPSLQHSLVPSASGLSTPRSSVRSGHRKSLVAMPNSIGPNQQYLGRVMRGRGDGSWRLQFNVLCVITPKRLERVLRRLKLVVHKETALRGIERHGPQVLFVDISWRKKTEKVATLRIPVSLMPMGHGASVWHGRSMLPSWASTAALPRKPADGVRLSTPHTARDAAEIFRVVSPAFLVHGTSTPASVFNDVALQRPNLVRALLQDIACFLPGPVAEPEVSRNPSVSRAPSIGSAASRPPASQARSPPREPAGLTPCGDPLVARGLVVFTLDVEVRLPRRLPTAALADGALLRAGLESVVQEGTGLAVEDADDAEAASIALEPGMGCPDVLTFDRGAWLTGRDTPPPRAEPTAPPPATPPKSRSSSVVHNQSQRGSLRSVQDPPLPAPGVLLSAHAAAAVSAAVAEGRLRVVHQSGQHIGLEHCVNAAELRTAEEWQQEAETFHAAVTVVLKTLRLVLAPTVTAVTRHPERWLTVKVGRAGMASVPCAPAALSQRAEEARLPGQGPLGPLATPALDRVVGLLSLSLAVLPAASNAPPAVRALGALYTPSLHAGQFTVRARTPANAATMLSPAWVNVARLFRVGPGPATFNEGGTAILRLSLAPGGGAAAGKEGVTTARFPRVLFDTVALRASVRKVRERDAAAALAVPLADIGGPAELKDIVVDGKRVAITANGTLQRAHLSGLLHAANVNAEATVQAASEGGTAVRDRLGLAPPPRHSVTDPALHGTVSNLDPGSLRSVGAMSLRGRLGSSLNTNFAFHVPAGATLGGQRGAAVFHRVLQHVHVDFSDAGPAPFAVLCTLTLVDAPTGLADTASLVIHKAPLATSVALAVPPQRAREARGRKTDAPVSLHHRPGATAADLGELSAQCGAMDGAEAEVAPPLWAPSGPDHDAHAAAPLRRPAFAESALADTTAAAVRAVATQRSRSSSGSGLSSDDDGPTMVLAREGRGLHAAGTDGDTTDKSDAESGEESSRESSSKESDHYTPASESEDPEKEEGSSSRSPADPATPTST